MTTAPPRSHRDTLSDILALQASRWHQARRRERAAMRGLQDAIREAHAAGIPAAEIARRAEVNRRTVRRALGAG